MVKDFDWNKYVMILKNNIYLNVKLFLYLRIKKMWFLKKKRKRKKEKEYCLVFFWNGDFDLYVYRFLNVCYFLKIIVINKFLYIC